MVNVCTLCSGTAFGECVLTDGYHSVCVISNEPCTLLRVAKPDFQDIWATSAHFMEDIVTPSFELSNVVEPGDVNNVVSVVAPQNVEPMAGQPQQQPNQVCGQPLGDGQVLMNEIIPAAGVPASQPPPVVMSPERAAKEELQLPENVFKSMHVGWIIRLAIDQTAPHLIRDRKHPSSPNLFEKCFISSELTDWLINTTMSSSHVKVRSRKQAESVYQVLYENRVIYSGEFIILLIHTLMK